VVGSPLCCQHDTNDSLIGLSEMGTAVAMTPSTQRIMPAADRVGNFLPGIQFRVVKDDGCLATSGQRGELWVSGPAMAIGYLDEDQAFVFLHRVYKIVN
jgi:4-coumarate--CoA ligase